ncbi:MAG: polyamine aminopropyltransferase [Aigarchaeota archaeon]|nr:polyamine aminopropyltransferase [Candidatus Pelearchaeum maunauluense]
MSDQGEIAPLFLEERRTKNTIVLHRLKRVLYSGRTRYQRVDVVELFDYGLGLVLDGQIQSTAADEWIYHETLVHPALVTHPRPVDALLIGGGEGATAREILRHNTVKSLTMIDIDQEVIELCKRLLSSFHQGSFDNPRLRLVIGDGRAVLDAQPDNSLDVIVVDATDPIEGGPAALLYTREFYEIVKRKLRGDGVIVTQATSTFYSADCYASVYRTIKSVFGNAHAYYVWVPSFLSAWGFVLATRRGSPRELGEEEVRKRLEERGVSGLRFYSPELHRTLFIIPAYLNEVLEKRGRIVSDDSPVFIPI